MTNLQYAAMLEVNTAEHQGGLYLETGGGTLKTGPNDATSRRTLRALVKKGLVVECQFSWTREDWRPCTGYYYLPAR